MTTPRGSLKSISTALKRLARRGSVEKFRAYVASDAFLTAFGELDPTRRRSVMRAFAAAEALCEAKAPLPLAAPKRIDAKRAEKISWTDPRSGVPAVRSPADVLVLGDLHRTSGRLGPRSAALCACSRYNDAVGRL
jgi:hypothetical protein